MYVFTWRNLPEWCGYVMVQIYAPSLRKAIKLLAKRLADYAYDGHTEQDIAKVLRQTPYTKYSIEGMWDVLL